MVATWRIVAAALLIFAAGVITGGLTTGASMRASRWPGANGAKPASPESRPPVARAAPNRGPIQTNPVPRIEAFRRAGSQLDLSDEQKTRIDQLLAESSDRVRALWAPVTTKVQQEFRDLRRKISGELTPEQKQRFDSLVDRRGPASALQTGTNGVATPLR